MSAPNPLAQPFRVTPIEDEVVFLGSGPISFSMTVDAARASFHSLAEALQRVALARSAEAGRGPTRLVIMVVDDEPMLRELGSAVLQEAGYLVVEAPNAIKALEVLEAGLRVDVLFTDVQMPGEMDGLELVQRVRRRWPAIKLLVTSGKAAPIALPTDGRFLAKPYLVADLLEQIDDMMALA